MPICGIIFSSLEKMAHYKAKAAGGGDITELTARVQALEGEMDGMRQQLVETQERLDFAERLLAQSEPAKVPQLRAGT